MEEIASAHGNSLHKECYKGMDAGLLVVGQFLALTYSLFFVTKDIEIG